ncbi:thiamine pyrophosphate-binding protein [Brachybacterium endophyticum]|uniref:Thiamine pyrophosphate-binding protein n=1 Tax=Brachybacterium endophyticum TaxID=2182385 RepID=A0A2U2RN10_9MICO|nr:thiamine pyrophosphate-binding protein [Brachybacterium endophyticum]PWH07164.1 thiamine pyrophosphate-binding protein [Brachybacterium endophyticum]
MPTVSAHVAAVLARRVEHVFGVMGNGNAHLLDALASEPHARYVAVRHEAGAVAAADAHYRVSGRLAAATTTYGAGFTNTLTALAEAQQARIPLVLVAGDAPTTGPRSWDVDQTASAAALGVRTLQVGADDAGATTEAALDLALRERCPVVLAIPYDLASQEVGDLPAPSRPALLEPVPPDPQGVEGVAELLARSERPLLLLGRGAWLAGAGEAVGELAERLGALTASTALARSLAPDPRFDLGVTGGFGAEAAMGTVADADLVLAIGASLSPFTMRFGALLGEGARLVQIDVAGSPTHTRVDRYLQGDARLATLGLVDALRRRGAASTRWRESVDVPALLVREQGEALAPDGRLDPRSLAAHLAPLLPADRVVVSDGGHFIGWANMYWPIAAPERMVMVGTAYQTIGLGWPCVVGAAAAGPRSTVVLTTGDGGGLMALADLESAVRVAGGHGMAVVWNDAAYGAEVNLYGLQGLDQTAMRIPEVDVAALAAAVGAEGHVVRTLDDLDVLRRWTDEDPAQRRFLVLDCRISVDVISPHQREVIAANPPRATAGVTA